MVWSDLEDRGIREGLRHLIDEHFARNIGDDFVHLGVFIRANTPRGLYDHF